MIEPVRIEPDALYDDGSLRRALGLTSASLAAARRAGLLRFTSQGKRTLYKGAWILDWLDAPTEPHQTAAGREADRMGHSSGPTTSRADSGPTSLNRSARRRPPEQPSPFTSQARPPARPGPALPVGLAPVLGIDDLAELLSCSRRLVERMRSAGRVPMPDIKIGRMPRWKPETIRAWIERGGKL